MIQEAGAVPGTVLPPALPATHGASTEDRFGKGQVGNDMEAITSARATARSAAVFSVQSAGRAEGEKSLALIAWQCVVVLCCPQAGSEPELLRRRPCCVRSTLEVNTSRHEV